MGNRKIASAPVSHRTSVVTQSDMASSKRFANKQLISIFPKPTIETETDAETEPKPHSSSIGR